MTSPATINRLLAEYRQQRAAAMTNERRFELSGAILALERALAEEPQPSASDDEIVEAINRVLIGCNHLATYSHDWPSWKLDGLTRTQQVEAALRTMGATKDYDMWCCWSTIMQERDILTTPRQHLTPPSTTRSAEEVRQEIERAKEKQLKTIYESNQWWACESHLAALHWVINEQRTGR